MVFFVLSGFLIGANVLRSIESQRWDWGTYAAGRLARLYIVLVPALLLGILWDGLGMAWTGSGGIYGGLVRNASIHASVSASLSWSAFFGNLLFLQTIVFQVSALTVRYRSLSNEFWYYVMFPLGVLAVGTGRSIGYRLFCLLALAVVAAFIGYSITRLILVWLFGVALNLMPGAKE